MATLFMAVWGDATQTLVGQPIQQEVVTVGAGSLQSAAIVPSDKKAWRRVRLFTDTDCYVTWGDDPTAVADGSSGIPMGAENPEVFTIQSGQKIAVIAR